MLNRENATPGAVCGQYDVMILSVCVAALALAHSGILTGKKATTYHLNGGNRQKQLGEYGVEVINEPIVQTDAIVLCRLSKPLINSDTSSEKASS